MSVLRAINCALLCIITWTMGCDTFPDAGGHATVSVDLKCQAEPQPVTLEPGKYVVRLSSGCGEPGTIRIGDQKVELPTTRPFRDAVVEVPEGAEVQVLCPGPEGTCRLQAVRLEVEMEADKANYLPPVQLGDDCATHEPQVIAVATAKSVLRLWYSPCVGGKGEIRVVDGQGSTMAKGGGSTALKDDIWFTTQVPMEPGWRLEFRCVEGTNGTCRYTLGWR